MPLDYNDPSKFNRFDTKAVSGILAAAVVLDRMYWVDQDDASKNQVGDLDAFDGGEIRGLRVAARTSSFAFKDKNISIDEIASTSPSASALTSVGVGAVSSRPNHMITPVATEIVTRAKAPSSSRESSRSAAGSLDS